MYEVSSCTQVLGFSFNITLLSFFQIGNTGFSIGAAKKANRLSLVIGPGAGYNLVSHWLHSGENICETKILCRGMELKASLSVYKQFFIFYFFYL